MRRTADTAYVVIAIWAAIYTWRALVSFYSLNTNAFDLSVFDYALASLGRGELGRVPFMGHSIFSHHFMPILVLLVPIRTLFQSPAALLVVQILAVGGAAALLARFHARLGLAPLASAGLVFVFLFARRTHAAAASLFYPECFQAPLVIAVVLAWSANARRMYWIIVVLLLMTKEDAGLYVAAFGALQAALSPERRRAALATVGLSAAWALAAVLVAIPLARDADGLAAANPLFESRFGASGGAIDPAVLAGRLFSVGTLETVASVFAGSGFLALWAPIWLLPALPGMAINMAADPATMQADLTNHYAWPVLPWMAIAAAVGWQRVAARWRKVGAVWLVVLVAFTAIDNPALQRLHRTGIDPAATQVIAQLHGRHGTVMLAQPNLIPHLAHHPAIYAVGADLAPPATPDLVLLTDVGNLWPLASRDARTLIDTYSRDARYERVADGPLYVFQLRSSPLK